MTDATPAAAASPSASSPRISPQRSPKSPLATATIHNQEQGHGQGQGVPIEADSEATIDNDSALGDSDQRSMTTSLASSILDYTYEPNDDTEQDRLDMLHHIFKLVLRGNLFRAPIEKQLDTVLDFGTGTGIWAIDIADEFPSALVTGNDFSPIQPLWVPPNCVFVIDDVESPWPPDRISYYDLVHGRNMVGSIGDWDKLFRQAFRSLRPGGWIEMQEFDVWFRSEEGELPADSAIQEWQKHLDIASSLFGKRLNVASELKEKVVNAGFEHVRDDIFKVPIGSWPRNPKLKEQGRYLQVQMLDSVEPISLAYFTRILEWTEAKTQVFLAQVRKEFLNNKTHLFVYCHIVYGQRPGMAGSHE